MEIVVIIWLASGILCSMIASSKGHSGCMGCLGGLLFGIFAVIYYAAIPVKPK